MRRPLPPPHHHARLSKLWLARRGYGHLGPVEFEIKTNQSTRLQLRFTRVLPVLAVRVRDGAGKPVDHCRVDVLTADRGSAIPLLPDELYSVEYWPSHLLETATDGRCFVPVPAQGRISVGVAWGLDGKTLVPRHVSLPSQGTVGVDFVLDWKLVAKEVTPHSTANAAGLQPGDIIVAWAGKTPKRPDDCTVGDATAHVVVRRQDRNVSLRLPPNAAGFVIDWELFAR